MDIAVYKGKNKTLIVSVGGDNNEIYLWDPDNLKISNIHHLIILQRN